MLGSNFALLVKSPGDDGQQLLTSRSRYVYRWSEPRMCIIHSSSPGLRMQLQVGLISCTAVTRGKKPLPLLVEYIESR